MDNVKIDRLDELEKHVEVLVATPATQIDAKLFDDVELQLTREFISSLYHLCLRYVLNIIRCVLPARLTLPDIW